MARKKKTANFSSLEGIQQAAREAQSQVRGSVTALRKEGEKLVSRVRKEADKLVSRDQGKLIANLVEQATDLRNDFQKRAKKAYQELESRGEKLVKRLEAQAAKLEPFVSRLSLPSKADIESLKKRLANLERRVEELFATSKSTSRA